VLRTFRELREVAIRATDGRIGTVRDFYFADTSWRIRYCVVDTGRWFSGRYVLIGPRALSISDLTRGELWVRLSKSEIMRSRTADSDKPVSQQQRTGLTFHKPEAQLYDPHLRSCAAVLGHRLKAMDGRLGHVRDFQIDDKGWVIRRLIVDPRKWNSRGERLLLDSRLVGDISWPNASVSIYQPRAVLMTAPIDQPVPAHDDHAARSASSD
jgi:hypothetical protein